MFSLLTDQHLLQSQIEHQQKRLLVETLEVVFNYSQINKERVPIIFALKNLANAY